MANLKSRAKIARELIHRRANVAQALITSQEAEALRTIDHARETARQIVRSSSEGELLKRNKEVSKMFNDHEKADIERFKETNDSINQIYEVIPEHISVAIEKTVNGHIREIDGKLDAHIQKVEPLLEALATGKSLSSALSWLGNVAMIIVALVAAWKLL